MSDYNLISFNDVWLTEDGTQTGRRCKTSVSLDGLLNDYTGQMQKAIDNTPYAQGTEILGVGTDIKITVNKSNADELLDIKDELNGAFAADDTVNVTITGTAFPSGKDMECLPGLPKAIEWPGEQDENSMYALVINVTVLSVN